MAGGRDAEQQPQYISGEERVKEDSRDVLEE